MDAAADSSLKRAALGFACKHLHATSKKIPYMCTWVGRFLPCSRNKLQPFRRSCSLRILYTVTSYSYNMYSKCMHMFYTNRVQLSEFWMALACQPVPRMASRARNILDEMIGVSRHLAWVKPIKMYCTSCLHRLMCCSAVSAFVYTAWLHHERQPIRNC